MIYRIALFVTLAGLLWSLDGLLIKSIDWHPMAIAAGRSAIAIPLMLACVRSLLVIGWFLWFVRRKTGRIESSEPQLLLTLSAAVVRKPLALLSWVQRRTFLISGNAFLLLSAGCQTTQQLADNAPAAKTPSLTSISSVVPRTCAWTNFTPNIAGNYELLPSGHPNGDIRVVSQAPYPSTIKVDIQGQFFLREADNTQSPGEGYYKVNSITLAATQDTFDWDITVTPPASQRVEVQFRLNIANVSINPAFSGTDKTSDPLRLQLVRRSVADLPDWLAHNTNVRDAIVWEFPNGTQDYSSWTAQRKQLLRDRFAKA